MVDNFDRLREFMKFDKQGDFYFLELIQRKKDGCNVRSCSNNFHRLVKDFYITSVEKYDSIKDEVISLCNATNARAYLRLNKRNYKDVCMAFAERVLNKIRTNQEFKNPQREIACVIGEFHSAGNDKTWVVDCDDTTLSEERVGKVLSKISQCEPIGIEKVAALIPTKSGVHIISKPFNMDKFNEKVDDLRNEGGEIEIKKDNPTLLYCP